MAITVNGDRIFFVTHSLAVGFTEKTLFCRYGKNSSFKNTIFPLYFGLLNGNL